MTRSFETMIDSATHSTMTLAVAAESPPTMVISAIAGEPACKGKASTVMSRSIEPSGNTNWPATTSGMTNRLIATR